MRDSPSGKSEQAVERVCMCVCTRTFARVYVYMCMQLLARTRALDVSQRNTGPRTAAVSMGEPPRVPHQKSRDPTSCGLDL